MSAPKITAEHIENTILTEQYHVFEGTNVTVCCLTLKNGFNTVGESACVSAENFDPVIGRRVAREKAFGKIWALEGYLLKQSLHEARQ